jgi:tRNA pseudouridine55 synthase
MSAPPSSRVPLDGVLVIDKPRGPTSHDVVARLRRTLGTREVGHAGTLDPMATGVLVVCLGEATKLSSWLAASDKAYEATIALGAETDTLDADGTVTKRADVPLAILEALDRIRAGSVHPHIERALAAERARTTQVPPAVSAIKKDGVRSYADARRKQQLGETPAPLEPRAVAIRALEAIGGGRDEGARTGWLAVTCDVTKGFYVRALARDLAEALGTLGYLTALRRLRSGPFDIEEAMPLDTPADELAARLIKVERAATRALPVARLTESGTRDARFGRALRPEDASWTTSSGPHAWLGPQGELVAVGERTEDGTGRVLRGFASEPAGATL